MSIRFQHPRGWSLVVLAVATTSSQSVYAQTSSNKVGASWTSADIVVTGERQTYRAPTSSAATRTDTPLIEVPQSVQVTTHSLLQEQDRRSLAMRWSTCRE